MIPHLGIDIGGSGIKGAPVDVVSGTLAASRRRIPTPQPALVRPVCDTLRRIVETFPDATDPIGCTFPGIVISGRIYSAANLDDSWIGVDAGARFSEACGRPVVLINDADAAGLAEARFGAGAGRAGVVLVLTLGTGIGSALLHNGRLVPNTELGHLELGGEVIERRASNRGEEGAEAVVRGVDRAAQPVPDPPGPPAIPRPGGNRRGDLQALQHLRPEAALPSPMWFPPCCATTPAWSARRCGPPVWTTSSRG